MLSEEKAIENLKGFKSINVLYGNTFVMFLEQLKKYQESTETVLGIIDRLQKENSEKDKQINQALDIAFKYGQADGGHHKAWVIDQMVKVLTGKEYDKWINNYIYDEETGDSYTWDKGIAP